VWNGLIGRLKAEFELQEVTGKRQLSVGDAVLRRVVRASVIHKKLLMSRLNCFLILLEAYSRLGIHVTAVNTDARIVSTGCREEIGKFSTSTLCQRATMSSLIIRRIRDI